MQNQTAAFRYNIIPIIKYMKLGIHIATTGDVYPEIANVEVTVINNI